MVTIEIISLGIFLGMGNKIGDIVSELFGYGVEITNYQCSITRQSQITPERYC